jgi:hypothetical protein
MADVCVLPLRKGAAQSSIPSKLPAYLFSAKPILGVLDREGDTARCIHEAGCGWVEEPGKKEAIARRLREIVGLPEQELHKMGEKARIYGLEYFSRQRGMPRLATIVVGQERSCHLNDKDDI